MKARSQLPAVGPIADDLWIDTVNRPRVHVDPAFGQHT
jgi:hypothetical protein